MTKILLQNEVSSRRSIEIGLIVNNQSMIIVSAKSDSRVGQYFNPSGLITNVLENPRAVMITTLMNSSEFLAEKPPVWTNSYVNLSLQLNSSLNPVNGGPGPVAIRLSALPVYTAGNSDTSSPDGVMVFGDIINGKAGFNEIVVSAYKTGYAGTYHVDPATNRVQLLSGVFRNSESSNYEYDVDVSSLLQAQASAMSSMEEEDTILFQTTFRGQHYEFAIIRVSGSFFVDCSYTILPQTGFDTPIFHVRGTSSEKWYQLGRNLLAVQLASIFIQSVASVGISYLLYRPVRRFIQSMGKFKPDGPGDSGSKSATSSAPDCFDRFWIAVFEGGLCDTFSNHLSSSSSPLGNNNDLRRQSSGNAGSQHHSTKISTLHENKLEQ
eukprot:TRINITY_DN9426_c0_g2_i1.p1 TRINITY_DN9426_c0_g2~~TRINITY_DN9426_c0_g2_i1.p1  ORF type:complete len:405 (-),score=101.81 TRINITY_DN9426_c0_g2_i1:465-1604(-)